MTAEPYTYEELSGIYCVEVKHPLLCNVPLDFYQRIAETRRQAVAAWEAEHERDPDGLMCEGAQAQVKRIRRISEDILRNRAVKVCHLGIRKGMGKDRNMRMAAAALRMAVTASLWVLTVWDIKTLLHGYSTPEDDPSPEYCPRKSAAIFFHPDCHCRYRIHTGSALARSRTWGPWAHHRRWGLAPRPEDERFGCLPPLYAKPEKRQEIFSLQGRIFVL